MAQSDFFGNPIDKVPDSYVDPSRQMDQYQVILHNCACHTFDEVQFALHYLCGLPKQVATDKTFAIDKFGKSIVTTTNLEAAEFFAERLKSVPGNQGIALNVTIEPVR